MSGEQFLVDPRLVVKTFEKRGRSQLDQIAEPDAVFRQQRQMVTRLFQRPGIAFEAAIGGDVGLVAENRIDAGFLGLL